LEFVKANTKNPETEKPYETPSQIIESRIDHTTSRDLNIRHYWEDQGKLFAHALNKTSKRYHSKKSYLRTMLSFFSKNHVKMEYSRGELFDILEHTKEEKTEREWIPSNEEVRLLYRMAQTARDRAILLTLYQSGLSEIDVAELRIEQLRFYDNQNGNWNMPLNEDLYFKTFREKSDFEAQTCISRECLEEIRIMLQSRGFPKEGFLFVSVHDNGLATRDINDIIKAIVERAFNGKAKEWKTKHLRDAFMNALEKAKVPTEIKCVIVGHTRQNAQKSYAVAEDTIKTLYAESFKFLTINGYGSQSRKIEELQNDFQRTKNELIELITELRTENKGLKTQLASIENKPLRQNLYILREPKTVCDTRTHTHAQREPTLGFLIEKTA
jgi:site-specific recombinase XerD